MNGKIYLVATPIGNLEDMTLRAIKTLKEVDIIAAEDTRHTLKLLNHFEIKKPLISYHRHNEETKSDTILEIVKQGKNVAIVSDAGTPGISDPGEEIVKAAKTNLQEKYKNIKIVGYENGFIKNNEDLIKKINDSGANIVFIAMGSPKQEKWIYENSAKIKANIFMGVGGTFDIVSDRLKRAPKWIRKMGIEWLYRMLKEPKRLKNVPLQIKYWYKLKKERWNFR